MNRYDENYERVLYEVRRAGKDGVAPHQLAQELFLDTLIASACIARAIKSKRLTFNGDKLVVRESE